MTNPKRKANIGCSMLELSYNVMKRTDRFVSLQASVVITEDYNVIVNCKEIIGAIECLTI
jgi:hypothetical protein